MTNSIHIKRLVKRLSRKQAINKNCKECIYDPSEAGTWRMQVAACSMTTCAFYDWRPLPIKALVSASKDSRSDNMIPASLFV